MQNEVILKNVNNFSISQIAESGQTFRWDRNDDGSYLIVAFNKAIVISQNDNNLIIKRITKKEYETTFKHYFALDINYLDIIDSLKGKDKSLDEAIIYGSGIRILNQDIWEMIISFIISGNNNIPRIKSSINKISEKYGDLIGEINGKKIYSFPTPKQLSIASIDELRECGVGYRDKYIFKTTQMIVNNEVDLKNIKDMEIDNLRNELMKLLGVGNKVADCIMLFSCNKLNAFPVDTWVKKILKQYYEIDYKSNKKINEFANNYFGEFAGIAQQYLFNYMRNKK
jgi:N-glycosylase/DNA lyase